VTDQPIQERSLEEWYMRRALCRAAIRVVSGCDDPRRESSLAHYNAQLKEIDERIEAITGKKPPVVIGLQTQRLVARKLTLQ